jgi:hypothetical protein
MENDSSRKAAFASELKDSEHELQRLAMVKSIPDDVKYMKEIIEMNALGVLEAILNLVGQQLSYFATTVGKLGLFSLIAAWLIEQGVSGLPCLRTYKMYTKPLEKTGRKA